MSVYDSTTLYESTKGRHASDFEVGPFRAQREYFGAWTAPLWMGCEKSLDVKCKMCLHFAELKICLLRSIHESFVGLNKI